MFAIMLMRLCRWKLYVRSGSRFAREGSVNGAVVQYISDIKIKSLILSNWKYCRKFDNVCLCVGCNGIRRIRSVLLFRSEK